MIEMTHKAEVDWSGGRNKSFNTIEEAKDFAEALNDSFILWADGKCYMDKVYNHFTGEYKVTTYKD